MQTPNSALNRIARVLRETTPLQWALYVLILFGCGLRVYNVIEHNPMSHIWSDPQRHWDHAREPMMPSPMALFDPPVYQTFLSIVQRFTAGIPQLIAVYIGALSLIGPWCWYRFLRETTASKTLALLGWAILAALPTWIGIYSYFMTETLFLPTLGASLWLTARARRKNDFSSFMAMVAMWLACGLTRAIAIPAAGLLGLWVWWRHPAKIKTVVWSVALAAAIMVPVGIRNYAFYRIWTPHGNGWINKIYATSGARSIELHFTQRGAAWVYGFGSPSIDTHPLAPLSDWSSSRKGTVIVNVDFDNGSHDWEKCWKANAVSGSALWRLRLENIVFLFFGDSWPDNNPAYTMGYLANVSRWIWAPLFAVLLIASACWWRILIARPLLPIALATWLFFQGCMLVVPNEGRYRKPLEGLFVAWALTLVDARLAEKKVARRKENPADDKATEPTPITP
jgi:4-amino-4-deoxy-L-arabinose transferase-like glycosyltransferase